VIDSTAFLVEETFVDRSRGMCGVLVAMTRAARGQ
jgi:hypothetical protein